MLCVEQKVQARHLDSIPRKILAVVEDFGYVGEQSFSARTPANATCTALSYVDCMSLHADDYQVVALP